MYDPAKIVTEILKGLCSSEQACEICLFKDEITSTLLSPISHFLDVAVSIFLIYDVHLVLEGFSFQTVILEPEIIQNMGIRLVCFLFQGVLWTTTIFPQL